MSVSSIVDIVFVALIILLAVIGLYKGFLKSAISVVGTAASALIAFVIAEPFGKLLEAIFKLTTKLTDKIADWLYSLSEFFTITRTGESFSDISGEMSAGGVSGIVQKLANLLLKGANIPENQTVGEVLGGKIAAVLTTIIAFIVAFVLIRIILKILEKLSDKITEVKIFGAIDKVLGFVFGLAKGLLYAGIVAVIASVMGYFVPSIDAKFDGIVNDTRAFQKYYDFINYNVCEYIDEKLGKNETSTPAEPTKISIDELTSDHLLSVTHIYITRDGGKLSGTVYFADMELTAKNYKVAGDFFVEYTSAEDLDKIIDLVEANSDPIAVIYEEIAVEKTLAQVKDKFSEITYFYIDTTNKIVAFKTIDGEITKSNYMFECEYIVKYTEDADLTAIQTAITEYNATVEDAKKIKETV